VLLKRCAYALVRKRISKKGETHLRPVEAVGKRDHGIVREKGFEEKRIKERKRAGSQGKQGQNY